MEKRNDNDSFGSFFFKKYIHFAQSDLDLKNILKF